MKTKLFFVVLVIATLSGCDKYLVPDDFPKEEFYSYAPYQQNDVVRFISDGDTLTYIVSNVSENYFRYEKGYDCGKEHASKFISFSSLNSNKYDRLVFGVTCSDREYFCINLISESMPRDIIALYKIDFFNEDTWSKSFDNYKIFKYFVDEIVLTQDDKPAAKVKKGQGLLWFVDETGRTWTAE